MFKSKKRRSVVNYNPLARKPKRSRKSKLLRAGLGAAGISLLISGLSGLAKKDRTP